MESFGIKFGRLVKAHRGIEALTQEDLAAAAFGDPGKFSRISEIEGGKVHNPRAKTVDAICVALNITREDRMACYPAATGAVRTPALPERLLEVLALRYDDANPDASEGELEVFLKDKSREHREMKARLEAIAATEGRIANLLAAAQEDVEAGAFDRADARLADAEEMQQAEHTLVQIRKQADLRVERARAALLRDDTQAAYDHFIAAAAFFEAFDRDEACELRHRAMPELYFHGDRTGGAGIALAADLLRRNLDHWTPETNAPRWAATQNNLAEALRSMGIAATDNEALSLLTESVAAYRAALSVQTRDSNPELWGTLQNNLGIALMDHGTKLGGEAGQGLFAEALEAYRAALKIHTRADEPDDWAMTHNNIGNTLRRRGEAQPGAEGLRDLAAAVDAYRAALEIRTREGTPLEWAKLHNNLAIALKEQALRSEADIGRTLASEAVAACQAALEVRSRVDEPLRWAETQQNIANAYIVLAKVDPDAAETHLNAALVACEGALEIYDPDTAPHDRAYILEQRAEIEQALASPDAI